MMLMQMRPQIDDVCPLMGKGVRVVSGLSKGVFGLAIDFLMTGDANEHTPLPDGWVKVNQQYPGFPLSTSYQNTKTRQTEWTHPLRVPKYLVKLSGPPITQAASEGEHPDAGKKEVWVLATDLKGPEGEVRRRRDRNLAVILSPLGSAATPDSCRSMTRAS